jgi:hypothetical protein
MYTNDIDSIKSSTVSVSGKAEAIDPTAIPFLPNLGPNFSKPPISVNIDDLKLIMKMETGNVQHWDTNVAAEYDTNSFGRYAHPSNEEEVLRKQMSISFQFGNIEDIIMELAPDAQSSNGTIPSNDPRKGISHIRPNLTDYTDAASSLQGMIDFKELKLIDVIGGGGFGQVWRAVLRGTPGTTQH